MKRKSQMTSKPTIWPPRHPNSDVAVIQVLQSDYLTQGPAVPKFEQVVSKFAVQSMLLR